MITINSQLDMTPGAIPAVIHRSQYDSDFSIVFALFARTGNFTIASGTTAKVRGTKKSGTGYSATATVNISAKTVTVTGDQQMTVASGQNIFEIVLLSGTKELCSANFILNVERAALDMDTITDETVVPELEHLEEYTQQAAEQAAQSASVYAKSWAVGGTGKRPDEDTNNAKYWSEQAKGAVAGVSSFNGRTGAIVPVAGDYTTQTVKRGNNTLETVLTGIEGNITNLTSRVGSAESTIGSQGTRLTTAESNITSLQNNKVDKTTPLLNFDDTATDPLTDDGALANALTASGILSDVIPSGGGSLYLKKALTGILEYMNTLYVVEIKSMTGESIDAGGRKTFAMNVEKSGYTALGIVGVRIWDSEVFAIGKMALKSSKTVALLTIINTYTEERTPDSIDLYVLYRKS